MATKTSKAPAPATAAGDVAVADPVPAAAPVHPPMSAYQQLWVHHTGVALAKNQTGFIWALKADAATMIAAGDAVDPYTAYPLPYIGAKPPRPSVIVPIMAFTAASPTVVTAGAADVAKLKAGDQMKVRQIAGTPIAALDDATYYTVGAPSGTTFSLAVNLSAADITGATGTGTTKAGAASTDAPSPAPAPAAG